MVEAIPDNGENNGGYDNNDANGLQGGAESGFVNELLSLLPSENKLVLFLILFHLLTLPIVFDELVFGARNMSLERILIHTVQG